MKIPKNIHWNGQDFAVKYAKELDGGDSWGRTMLGSQHIFIEADTHRQKQEQTLIHELLHITFRGAGLDWESKQEEKAIKAWAVNIYGMLKDNNLLK